MCDMASAASGIRRITAKQPTTPAAAPVAIERARLLGSKLIVDVVADGCAVELFEVGRGEHGGGTPEERATMRKAQDVRRNTVDHAEIVGDEEGRELPLAPEPLERVVQARLTGLVHTGRGLVEEQDAGPAREGDGHEEPLELADRKSTRLNSS